MTAAGPMKSLLRLSDGIADGQTKRAVRQLEDRLTETQRRLADLERRFAELP